MREFTINSNDARQRLDKFIQKTLKGFPVSFMYKAIRTKKIKVNRKRAELNQILCEGDTVQMFIAEDFFEEKIQPNEFLQIKPKLSIVYEDEQILLCEKAPGVLVHSGDGDGKRSEEVSASDRNTLIFHIQAYLYQKGEYRPEQENSFAPALCNRIDRNTGGIVISAKTAQALKDMNERIKNRDISKYYLCAVHGKMGKKSDTLTDFLIKDEKNNMVKVYREAKEGAKEIITKYEALDYQKEKDVSLLRVELITGRTHQIRAHLSFYGHPLLGDGKYGNIQEDKTAGYKHQALYSYQLSFGTSKDSLSYLNGKTFLIHLENVYFLKEFNPETAQAIFHEKNT